MVFLLRFGSGRRLGRSFLNDHPDQVEHVEQVADPPDEPFLDRPLRNFLDRRLDGG
jgi:hypothetical protein